MVKKKALGDDPLSWIRPTVPPETEEHSSNADAKSETDSAEASSQRKAPSSEVPKFQTYEVQLSVRLQNGQLEFLSKLEREIMKSRSAEKRRERITKNSILRAAIDLMAELRIETSEIGDELELKNRFRRAIAARYGSN